MIRRVAMTSTAETPTTIPITIGRFESPGNFWYFKKRQTRLRYAKGKKNIIFIYYSTKQHHLIFFEESISYLKNILTVFKVIFWIWRMGMLCQFLIKLQDHFMKCLSQQNKKYINRHWCRNCFRSVKEVVGQVLLWENELFSSLLTTS